MTKSPGPYHHFQMCPPKKKKSEEIIYPLAG